MLAMPVHGAQFNGKQEGQAITAHLTCAAPATVSRRVFSQTKTQLSSETTGRHETGGWEGDEGRSVSPDTGQQGGGASQNALLNRSCTVGEGGEST